MTLFALIFALLLEQLRPLGGALRRLAPVAAVAEGLSQRLNDGTVGHGRIAWLLLVVLATLGTAVAYWLLWELQPVFAFVFNVVVLYLCMGFRHDLHSFNEIHVALRLGELARAQSLLADWRGGRYDEASASEVARLSIEMALVAAHRKLFGVVFWFVILPGPSGAVMYRVARLLFEAWGARRDGGVRRVRGAGAARLRGDRLAAGAHHRDGVLGGGQFRGCGLLLAVAGSAVARQVVGYTGCKWWGRAGCPAGNAGP